MIRLPDEIKRKIDEADYKWLLGNINGWWHSIPHKYTISILLKELCEFKEFRDITHKANIGYVKQIKEQRKENKELKRKLDIAVKALVVCAHESTFVGTFSRKVSALKRSKKAARQALKEIKK